MQAYVHINIDLLKIMVIPIILIVYSTRTTAQATEQSAGVS